MITINLSYALICFLSILIGIEILKRGNMNQLGWAFLVSTIFLVIQVSLEQLIKVFH